MNRLLARALKRAESTSGLARALRVSPSTVTRWKREGLPKGRKASLEKFLSRETKRKEERRTDRNRFLELMKLAGSLEKLPDIKSRERIRAGRQTIGVEHTKRVSQMLTLETIDRLEVWMKGLKRRFPTWQIVVVASQFGRGEHRGYKTVVQQIAPDAGDFAISSELATHASESLSEVMNAMREQLEDLAGDASVLTFVHAVTVYNYRHRTDEEIKAWQDEHRLKTELKSKRKKASRGWRAHPTHGEKPWPKPKPKKQKSPKSKSRTPTTTRSSALSQSSKSSARATTNLSGRASSRKESATSTSTRKSSSKPAVTTRSKSRKTMRTPPKKTTSRKTTMTKRSSSPAKQKPKAKSSGKKALNNSRRKR